MKSLDEDDYGAFYNSPQLYANQKAVIHMVQKALDTLMEHRFMGKGLGGNEGTRADL